jgi:hypothetical protein
MSVSTGSSTTDDTESFEEALREYRESTWDEQDFKDLPPDVLHGILQRAQDIKDRLRAVA